jgi:hypothetical protein
MPGPTHATTLPETVTQFEKDIQDVHLIYDYAAQAPDGTPERWKYEMYVPYLTSFLSLTFLSLLFHYSHRFLFPPRIFQQLTPS